MISQNQEIGTITDEQFCELMTAYGRSFAGFQAAVYFAVDQRDELEKRKTLFKSAAQRQQEKELNAKVQQASLMLSTTAIAVIFALKYMDRSRLPGLEMQLAFLQPGDAYWSRIAFNVAVGFPRG
jgi:hypothetical protein